MENEILVGFEEKLKQESIKMHYLLILDRSGSMSHVRELTIKGFNEYVQTILSESKKNNQDAFVSLIFFNNEVDVIHSCVEAKKLKELTLDEYVPSRSTALNDAIGRGIKEISEHFVEGEQIFITIFTDGEENSSRNYSSKQISDLIKEKQNLGWTITYIGCEIDKTQLAKNYGIMETNFLSYGAGQEGYNNATRSLNNSVMKMSQRRAAGDYSNTDIFKDEQ